MNAWRMAGMALGLALLASGTGCENASLKAQNESLLRQNQILEQRARSAEESAARSRADALAATAAAQVPPTVVPSQGGGMVAKAPPEEIDTVVKAGRGAAETFEVAGDATSDLGKATIKAAAKAKLNQIAAELKTKYAGRKVRVEGHTDALPVKNSGWDDNWDLGAARARAVLLYLISQGVAKQDLYIASFADNVPKSKTDVKLNRRVEIVVLK